MLPIISQDEAKVNGFKRFFTGIPCKKNAHICERLVSSGECVMCKRLREQAKYNIDPSGHRNYYLKNRDRLLAQQKRADDNRRFDKIKYGQQWRERNRDYAKNYTQRNHAMFRFHAATRRALMRKATPPWANMESVKLIYLEAARISADTGVPHEVDHIVPLKSNIVCGLHCESNLRIVTKVDNRTKHNHFAPE